MPRVERSRAAHADGRLRRAREGAHWLSSPEQDLAADASALATQSTALSDADTGTAEPTIVNKSGTQLWQNLDDMAGAPPRHRSSRRRRGSAALSPSP